jgi:teichuronic acid exporter
LSLRDKALKGLFWSFTDNSVSKGINFIVGIILARLLSPREFGLIGMLALFIGISETIINSGFGLALIRKTDCRQVDYNSAFFFNVVLSLIIYFILFAGSSMVSGFFNEPSLEDILKVLSLILIINAFGLVQNSILIKNLDFKTIALITFISSLLSGITSIVLAFKGFGVWSLVFKTLLNSLFTSICLWVFSKWRPTREFSAGSFTEMYKFGYKLLLSSLLYTTYINIYKFIIGKIYSADELGYYTRAEQFQVLPSSNISGVIQKVTLPLLTNFKDDRLSLKSNYRKMVQATMFLTFAMMIGMAAVAEPMIKVMIGEAWLPAVPYLQILCFAGMFSPLHTLNLNILFLDGRSDLGLRLEVYKVLIAIPVIIVGVFMGIKAMLIGMVVHSIISYYLNSSVSGKLIDYPVREQVHDIYPSFIIALLMGVIIYLFGRILPGGDGLKLILQITAGVALVLAGGHLIKLEPYIFIREIIRTRKYLFNKGP